MSIPMVDLKGQYHTLKAEIDAGIQETLENTAYILGPNVQAFEKEAADYLGVKHAVSCANGTDALHLALLAAGIGEGDEVITTPFTFIATAEAIVYVGAIPVFVDVEPDTYNIDPSKIEAAITDKTRAILPVHIFGQPADMSAIMAIAEKNKLKVIEDCAQSFGAEVDGKMTGGIGIAGCHSFFPSKNLGCYGDGGMVTTNDDDIAANLKQLRNHGSSIRYHHDIIGYNSRLDEIQAVVLRAKLKHIGEYNTGRRRAAHQYSAGLNAMNGTNPPHEDGKGNHVYHQYTLLSARRDEIMKALQDAGIGCAVYYPIPLHKQKAFADSTQGVEMPVSDDIAANCMSLPIFPELSEEQVTTVLDVIRGVVGD